MVVLVENRLPRMTKSEGLRAYAEGCLYIANGVRDSGEAERLRKLASDAIAKAETLERDQIQQQQQPAPEKSD